MLVKLLNKCTQEIHLKHICEMNLANSKVLKRAQFKQLLHQR